MIRTLAVRYPPGYRLETHAHDWSQLVYATEGVMQVHAEQRAWTVPPHRAVWVPAGVPHWLETAGSVALRTLYFSPALKRPEPGLCRVLQVSPLLKELVLHAIRLRMLSRRQPAHLRLIGVIADQVESAETLPLSLPMPRDPRALRLAERLRGDPGARTPIHDLAAGTGASKRTQERLFHGETGLTLGKWRQRLRLLHALRLMSMGEAATEAALACGYDSPSAFIAVFKKTFGATPGRYRFEDSSEQPLRPAAQG